MSSQGLQDILGWVALTKAVNAVKDGVPNPFPPYYFKVRPEDKIVGDSVKFNRTYGTRETARTVRYGAGAREKPMQQEELAATKFLSFSEKRTFDPYQLQVLRDYETYDNSDKAKRIVANNIKTLGTLFGNARVVALATSLAYGKIWDDANGNLLPTSSGAANTYDHLITAGNIGTVLDAASAGIFGATGGGSWASNSVDIPLQLRRLTEWAALDHGYEPEEAMYGKNIPSYFVQNDFVLDYMARNNAMQTEWLKGRGGSIPEGLFDFRWIPVWKASYTKNIEGTQTKTSLWPANGVTFVPGESDLEAYYSLFEGSNLIPTTIDIIPDGMAALNSLETVHGCSGYAKINHDPIAMFMVLLDCFWPGFKLLNVTYIADTVS
jgi:hypothetical protein